MPYGDGFKSGKEVLYIETPFLNEMKKIYEQNANEEFGPYPVNEEALKRLQIIEGQLKGIQKMCEEDKRCIDILNQISAVRAALDKVGKIILKRHIDNCVTNPNRNNGEKNKDLVNELMEVIAREEI